VLENRIVVLVLLQERKSHLVHQARNGLAGLCSLKVQIPPDIVPLERERAQPVPNLAVILANRLRPFASMLYFGNAGQEHAEVYCEPAVEALPNPRGSHTGRGPDLGANGPVGPGLTPWYDPFIRVPDYFAEWFRRGIFYMDEIPAAPPKVQQVRARVIAGHTNVKVVRLHFEHQAENVSLRPQTLMITPK
jgi:hypothetical protein